MHKSIFLGCLLLSATSLVAQNREWSYDHNKDCSGMRILRQPVGPFAVVLYCEDALGNYLAVVYADPIEAPSTPGSQRWTLDDRYWYEPTWGSDVTAYRWSTDGKSLFVATSEIYGSGGLFKLNLMERRSMQLLPKKKVSLNDRGPGYTLADIKSLR